MTREQRKSGLSRREQCEWEQLLENTMTAFFFIILSCKTYCKASFSKQLFFFSPSFRPLDSSWLKLWCHRNLEQYSRLFYVASTILKSKNKKNNMKGKKVKEKQIYNIYGTSISASSTPLPLLVPLLPLHYLCLCLYFFLFVFHSTLFFNFSVSTH